MRVVVDSNVIVAAFATQGLCHLVCETVWTQHEMLLSPRVIQEVERAALEKIKLPPAQVQEMVRFLKSNSTVLEDYKPPGIVCRDPDDLYVIGIALKGNAGTLVTGDADLLDLGIVQGVKIVSPRAFWESLRGLEKA